MKGERVPFRQVISNPVHFLAFGFGAGCMPVAPGTFGTVVAVPIYLLLAQLPAVWYAMAVAALFALGVWLCEKTASDLGVHDHSGIVWDEFVGLYVTMFMAPPGWAWLLLGFVLFRVFDIAKPFPIRHLDRRWRSGFGIMADDVLAGIYAAIVLQVVAYAMK